MTKKYLSEIPDLDNHYNREFMWNQHPTDPMIFVIYHWGKPVMSFFLGEAIEAAGYKHVMQHVNECNKTPWLHRWQKERKNMEYADVVNILKKDYENG
jgi:hypothetical protein